MKASIVPQTGAARPQINGSPLAAKATEFYEINRKKLRTACGSINEINRERNLAPGQASCAPGSGVKFGSS